jgi:hypothetical protein
MAGERGLAKPVPARLSAAEGRRFGLTVGGAFVLLAGLLWWRGRPEVSLAVALIGGCLMLAALALPARLDPVYRGWMKAAQAISKVTNPIVLAILYFVVLTPAGWMIRAFRGSPLRPIQGGAIPSPSHVGDGDDGKGRSFWVRRVDENARRSDLQRQF